MAARTVTIGGVSVTCAQAEAAAAALEASRASAIRSVLAAAGSPLAGCDYHAVYQPGMGDARRELEATGGIGPRGRHLAKFAFARAVRTEIDAAFREEFSAAMAAFGTDERYAAAMAGDAAAHRQRDHEKQARARAASLIDAAVRSCQRAGCRLAQACGTGACPYAPAELRGLTSPAEPGRIARPPGHAAGTPFSVSPAAAYLAAAAPWRAAVHVRDGDACAAIEAAA